jgi:hypothetical protein
MDSRMMVLATLAAEAEQNMGPRELVQREYDRYAAAFTARNLSGIEELLARDFEWKAMDGSFLSRAESLAEIGRQMDDIVSVTEMTAVVEQIETEFHRAIVRVRERMTAIVHSADGGQEQVVSEEMYQDVWIKTLTGWKLRLAELLTSDSTIQPM